MKPDTISNGPLDDVTMMAGHRSSTITLNTRTSLGEKDKEKLEQRSES